MNAPRFAIITTILLAGCAGTVTTQDGQVLRPGSREFQDYAQHVFREQNRVASVLAFAQDDVNPVLADSLRGLEDQLLTACADLNALAAARRDNRLPGIREQRRMAGTVPLCESATRQVEEESGLL